MIQGMAVTRGHSVPRCGEGVGWRASTLATSVITPFGKFCNSQDLHYRTNAISSWALARVPEASFFHRQRLAFALQPHIDDFSDENG